MVERIMQVNDIIDQLFAIQLRIQAWQPACLRPLLTQTEITARGTLVIGPRGTGKTTFLFEQAKKGKFLYFSADSPLVSDLGIWEIARVAFQRDFEGVIIDEVHCARKWSNDLKALYDAYPRKKIIASDSSSIVLQRGIADLSRRFVKISIPLLSFRDYVFLKHGLLLPQLNILKPDLRATQEILDTGPVMLWFREYLQGGLRPFFLEGSYAQRQLNVIEKMVFSDLPFVLPHVNDNILRLGNAVIGMLARSSIPTVNVDSTCRNWGVGKEKFYQLLAALEALSLIQIIDYRKSAKTRSKGAKIFLADPSHYSVLGGDLGNQREAYVAAELLARFGEVYASKDEKAGDFISEKHLFEVGGLSKKRKNADFVICDDLELPAPKRIPLWTLGLR
ncbi:MAG TPA: AAA family ATPase [Bdellovibrionales bacterium]|nr:AAA family ATPase [Bdellovibrionales bacterium]HCM38665.1 AAA family ATPase [Bdellovibrionales bacterium]